MLTTKPTSLIPKISTNYTTPQYGAYLPYNPTAVMPSPFYIKKKKYKASDIETGITNIDDPTEINSLADVLLPEFNRANPLDPINLVKGIGYTETVIKRFGDLVYNDLIKPFTVENRSMGDRFTALGLNLFNNFVETADVLANPVKGLFQEGLEGVYNSLTYDPVQGRMNHDFNIQLDNNPEKSFGEGAVDFALELVCDPGLWITFGTSSVAKGAIKEAGQGLRTIIKDTAKNLVGEVTEKEVKSIIKTIGKTALKEGPSVITDDLIKNTIIRCTKRNYFVDIDLSEATKAFSNVFGTDFIKNTHKILKPIDQLDELAFKAGFAPIAYPLKGVGTVINETIVKRMKQLTTTKNIFNYFGDLKVSCKKTFEKVFGSNISNTNKFKEEFGAFKDFATFKQTEAIRTAMTNALEELPNMPEGTTIAQVFDKVLRNTDGINASLDDCMKFLKENLPEGKDSTTLLENLNKLITNNTAEQTSEILSAAEALGNKQSAKDFFNALNKDLTNIATLNKEAKRLEKLKTAIDIDINDIYANLKLSSGKANDAVNAKCQAILLKIRNGLKEATDETPIREFLSNTLKDSSVVGKDLTECIAYLESQLMKTEANNKLINNLKIIDASKNSSTKAFTTQNTEVYKQIYDMITDTAEDIRFPKFKEFLKDINTDMSIDDLLTKYGIPEQGHIAKLEAIRKYTTGSSIADALEEAIKRTNPSYAKAVQETTENYMRITLTKILQTIDSVVKDTKKVAKNNTGLVKYQTAKITEGAIKSLQNVDAYTFGKLIEGAVIGDELTQAQVRTLKKLIDEAEHCEEIVDMHRLINTVPNILKELEKIDIFKASDEVKAYYKNILDTIKNHFEIDNVDTNLIFKKQTTPADLIKKLETRQYSKEDRVQIIRLLGIPGEHARNITNKNLIRRLDNLKEIPYNAHFEKGSLDAYKDFLNKVDDKILEAQKKLDNLTEADKSIKDFLEDSVENASKHNPTAEQNLLKIFNKDQHVITAKAKYCEEHFDEIHEQLNDTVTALKQLDNNAIANSFSDVRLTGADLKQALSDAIVKGDEESTLRATQLIDASPKLSDQEKNYLEGILTDKYFTVENLDLYDELFDRLNADELNNISAQITRSVTDFRNLKEKPEKAAACLDSILSNTREYQKEYKAKNVDLFEKNLTQEAIDEYCDNNIFLKTYFSKTQAANIKKLNNESKKLMPNFRKFCYDLGFDIPAHTDPIQYLDNLREVMNNKAINGDLLGYISDLQKVLNHGNSTQAINKVIAQANLLGTPIDEMIDDTFGKVFVDKYNQVKEAYTQTMEQLKVIQDAKNQAIFEKFNELYKGPRQAIEKINELNKTISNIKLENLPENFKAYSLSFSKRLDNFNILMSNDEALKIFDGIYAELTKGNYATDLSTGLLEAMEYLKAVEKTNKPELLQLEQSVETLIAFTQQLKTYSTFRSNLIRNFEDSSLLANVFDTLHGFDNLNLSKLYNTDAIDMMSEHLIKQTPLDNVINHIINKIQIQLRAVDVRKSLSLDRLRIALDYTDTAHRAASDVLFNEHMANKILKDELTEALGNKQGVFFDIETTGFNGKVNPMFELSYKKIGDTEPTTFKIKVTDEQIPDVSFLKTMYANEIKEGIVKDTPEDLKALFVKEYVEADGLVTEKEALQQFAKDCLLNEDARLVGHNIKQFDNNFILDRLNEAGVAVRSDVFKNSVDTLELLAKKEGIPYLKQCDIDTFKKEFKDYIYNLGPALKSNESLAAVKGFRGLIPDPGGPLKSALSCLTNSKNYSDLDINVFKTNNPLYATSKELKDALYAGELRGKELRKTINELNRNSLFIVDVNQTQELGALVQTISDKHYFYAISQADEIIPVETRLVKDMDDYLSDHNYKYWIQNVGQLMNHEHGNNFNYTLRRVYDSALKNKYGIDLNINNLDHLKAIKFLQNVEKKLTYINNSDIVKNIPTKLLDTSLNRLIKDLKDTNLAVLSGIKLPLNKVDKIALLMTLINRYASGSIKTLPSVSKEVKLLKKYTLKHGDVGYKEATRINILKRAGFVDEEINQLKPLFDYSLIKNTREIKPDEMVGLKNFADDIKYETPDYASFYELHGDEDTAVKQYYKELEEAQTKRAEIRDVNILEGIEDRSIPYDDKKLIRQHVKATQDTTNLVKLTLSDPKTAKGVYARYKAASNKKVDDTIKWLVDLNEDDTLSYMLYHCKGIKMINLQNVTLDTVYGMLEKFKNNPYVKVSFKTFETATPSSGVFITLTKEGLEKAKKLERLEIKEVYNLTECIKDLPEEIQKQILKNEKLINDSYKGANTFSNNTIISPSDVLDIVEQLPEELGDLTDMYKEICELTFDNNIAHFNHSMLGAFPEVLNEVGSKTDIIKQQINLLDNYVDLADLKTKYLGIFNMPETSFGPGSIFEDAINGSVEAQKEFLELFKNNDVYTVAVPYTKNGVHKVMEYKPTTLKDLAFLKTTKAQIVSKSMFGNMSKYINSFNLENLKAVKYYNTFLMGPLKLAYLGSPFRLIRNIVDSFSKSMMDLEDPGDIGIFFSCFKEAMQEYNAYNKVLKDIVQGEGVDITHLTTETIEKYFATRNPADKEAFLKVYTLMTRGPFAGYTEVENKAFAKRFGKTSKLYSGVVDKIEAQFGEVNKVTISKYYKELRGYRRFLDYDESFIKEYFETQATHDAVLNKMRKQIENMFGNTSEESIEAFSDYIRKQLDGNVLSQKRFLQHYDKLKELEKTGAKGFELYDTALDVIKGIGNTPGPNIIPWWYRTWLDKNNNFEHIIRMAQYKYSLNIKAKGIQRAFEDVARIHFDMSRRAPWKDVLELAFPFAGFKMDNVEFFMDMAGKSAWARTIMKALTSSKQLQDFEQDDKENNRSLQYHLLAGNPILNIDGVKIALKLNPGVMDTFGILNNTPKALMDSLAEPISSTVSLLGAAFGYNEKSIVSDNFFKTLRDLIPTVNTWDYTTYRMFGGLVTNLERLQNKNKTTANVTLAHVAGLFGVIKDAPEHEFQKYVERHYWKKYFNNTYVRKAYPKKTYTSRYPKKTYYKHFYFNGWTRRGFANKVFVKNKRYDVNNWRNRNRYLTRKSYQRRAPNFYYKLYNKKNEYKWFMKKNSPRNSYILANYNKYYR